MEERKKISRDEEIIRQRGNFKETKGTKGQREKKRGREQSKKTRRQEETARQRDKEKKTRMEEGKKGRREEG